MTVLTESNLVHPPSSSSLLLLGELSSVVGVVTECPPSSLSVLRPYDTNTILSTPQPPGDTAQTGRMNKI